MSRAAYFNKANNGKFCVMVVRPTDEVSRLMHKIHR